MDLDRHIAVLWKRRRIIIAGAILGIVTAILAAYQPTSGGLERRGGEEWSSSSMVLVTQKGFPWGRVTLPTATDGETSPVPVDPAAIVDGERLRFADPTRFSALALVYSVMSYSDRVRAMLPGRPTPDQISAVPFDPTGRGDQMLPIIGITTKAGSASAANELNRQTVNALTRVILREQRTNEIPEKDRVQLQVLKQADPPFLVAGRSWTSSMLAFILCIGAAVALAHILEGLSMARSNRSEAGLLGAEAVSDSVDLGLRPDLWNGGRVGGRDSGSAHGAPSAISEYRNRTRGG